MRSDEELRKTFKVFLNDNNIINIIYNEAVLDAKENIRHSELVEKEISAILENGSLDSYKIAMDNSQLGNMGIAPNESRKTYFKFFSDKRIKGAAIIGGSIYLRTVGNLLIGLIFGRKKIKLFSKKEKALKWLKSI